MIRSTLSALVGYFLFAVIVTCISMFCWFAFGSEFAFVEESVVVSNSFILTQITAVIVAALIGGWVTSMLAKDKRSNATMILVGIVLLLGFVGAMGQAVFPAPELPEGKSISELSFSGIQQYAQSPKWFKYSLPILGTLAAFIGSFLHGKQNKNSMASESSELSKRELTVFDGDESKSDDEDLENVTAENDDSKKDKSTDKEPEVKSDNENDVVSDDDSTGNKTKDSKAEPVA